MGETKKHNASRLNDPHLNGPYLDEQGFTLQAVILTAVLALGGVGASIVVFNSVSGESTDIVEVGEQTLDPFYEEQAEAPFWEYVKAEESETEPATENEPATEPQKSEAEPQEQAPEPETETPEPVQEQSSAPEPEPEPEPEVAPESEVATEQDGTPTNPPKKVKQTVSAPPAEPLVIDQVSTVEPFEVIPLGTELELMNVLGITEASAESIISCASNYTYLLERGLKASDRDNPIFAIPVFWSFYLNKFNQFQWSYDAGTTATKADYVLLSCLQFGFGAEHRILFNAATLSYCVTEGLDEVGVERCEGVVGRTQPPFLEGTGELIRASTGGAITFESTAANLMEFVGANEREADEILGCIDPFLKLISERPDGLTEADADNPIFARYVARTSRLTMTRLIDEDINGHILTSIDLKAYAFARCIFFERSGKSDLTTNHRTRIGNVVRFTGEGA